MRASGGKTTTNEMDGLRKGNWAARAIGWRRWHGKWALQSRAATDMIIRGAGIKPGICVLDLASGSGEPVLEIARRLGPGGNATAFDTVQEMLHIVKENSILAGLDNIHFLRGDADTLPYSDGSFDAVTCRFGIMFFADPVAAMKEIRRVLRPGGRACLVTWGPMEENPRFASTFGVVMRSLGEELGDYRPEVFKFDRPGCVTRVMADAGFSEVSAAYHTIPFAWHGTIREAWEGFRELSAPFRSLFERVPARNRKRLTGEILAHIGDYYDGEKVNFAAKVVLATCRRSC